MNFIISIIAWLVYNVAEMEIRRRELDEDGNPDTNFGLGTYAKQKIFIWIGSLLMCPLLLWIGANKIDIKPLGMLTDMELAWSDLYYLAAGFGFELIIFGIIKLRKFVKKVSS